MGAAYNTKKRLMRENEDYFLMEGKRMQKIMKDYTKSINRLIIIDHEGTLPRKIQADAEPSPFILSVLD
jgi:hypothetical protein